MKTIKDLLIKYKEIIMYLFIGGLTTVVSWVAYAVCTEMNFVSSLSNTLINLLNLKFEPEIVTVFISNVIAWILAVIFAYITNKLFVFESYNWKPAFVLKECFLFVSSRIVTGLLEIFAVPFLVGIGLNQTIFGIEGMLSKLLVSILVVVLNYILSKLFIFKDNK